LHGGLKALVAPDRAGREAVPNRAFSLRKKSLTQLLVPLMNLLEMRQNNFPWDVYYRSLPEKEDSRGPAASRQIKNSSKQSAVAVMRDNPKSASASRKGDAP